jgi:hypothetical protein
MKSGIDQNDTGIPTLVMGLQSPTHRYWKMIQVLTHYDQRFRKRAHKYTLLKYMVALEGAITDEEKWFIRDWILSEDDDFKEALRAEIERLTEEDDSEPEKECSGCAQFLLNNAFTQHTINPKYDHEIILCYECIARASILKLLTSLPIELLAQSTLRFRPWIVLRNTHLIEALKGIYR